MSSPIFCAAFRRSSIAVRIRCVSSVLGVARRGDGDVLLLARGLVLRLDVHDAVGVDVEGDLDLRNAAWRRRDAVEDEAREALVVGRELALALDDVDLDLRLTVARRGEDLR